jgi:hypothetical protein
MRSPLPGFLILFACASQCAAHGSIAYGADNTNTARFVTSQNQGSESDAETAALEECRTRGLSRCTKLLNFENTCAAVSMTSIHFNIGRGNDLNEAGRSAISGCLSDGQRACDVHISACDATPIPEAANSGFASPDFDWVNFLGPWLNWLPILVISGTAAAITLLPLVLPLLASVVSSAPPDVLKRRALSFVWIGLPAAIALIALLAGRLERFSNTQLLASAAALQWTQMFAALLIGGALRRRLYNKPAPHPLSLPLATLIVTVAATAALYVCVRHDLLSIPVDCPKESDFHLTFCGVFSHLAPYFAVIAAVWLIILLCGVALPAESNLIRANDRLKALVRRSSSAVSVPSQHVEGAASGSSGTYPPPALLSRDANQLWQDNSVAPASGPMMLKIKKSQTSNVWGTVIFIVDARMELSAEERYLVEKYRLGPMLIYSSSARSRHKEAIKAHLEGTKGHPVFTMSVKDQLMGVLKTFFRLGMAGAHAAMAAYHLKITVYKLMGTSKNSALREFVRV